MPALRKCWDVMGNRRKRRMNEPAQIRIIEPYDTDFRWNRFTTGKHSIQNGTGHTYRKPLTILASFTMLFSGGLIPTFLVVKNLGMYNTIWAMVLPSGIATYNMLVMKNFFQSSIPTELKEAAWLDGCSDFQTLVKVVLPLSGAIIAVMTLFYAVAHWNAYFNALIYLKQGGKNTRSPMPLQVVLREILLQNQELASGDGTGLHERMMAAETMKYAIIIVASLPVICMYPFVQKYFVKGVMVGAIKG